MKTARRSSLEGAVIGRVLTIVRGERSIMIPARELPELVSLLEELAPAIVGLADEPPTPFEVASSRPLRMVPAATDTPAPRPSRARRGRVWEGIKRTLTANGNTPVSFESLLKMVVDERLTERNASHALKIALGKKVQTGELEKVGDDYRLGTARKAKATRQPAPVASPPLRRRHRPGELWRNMKIWLAEFPEGRTRDEIVAAAAEGNWTPADDPAHAVKICLTRVGDQVLERDGRYILAEVATSAPTPAPTVRKRRRKEPAVAEPTPAEPAAAKSEAAEPEAAEAPAEVLDEDDPNFNASQFYPTPRSRLPR